MKRLLTMATVVASALVWADVTPPTVTLNTVSVNPNTRAVDISYTLSDAPGAVTLDIITNGVSIGQDKLRRVSGDLNIGVDAGPHTASWLPDGNLPAGFRVRLTAWAVDAPPPYMLIDLTAPARAKGTVRFFASEEALPYGCVTNNRIYKSDWLVMRKIPASNVSFGMGAVDWESGSYGNGSGEREVRRNVTLTNDYYLAVFETTDRQFHYLAGWDRGLFQGREDSPYRAVTRIVYSHLRGGLNWPIDGRDVVAQYSVLDNARAHTGVMLDLPTSAEWEFAARAGVRESLCDGTWIDGWDVDANVDSNAWYYPNSVDSSFPEAWSGVAPHEVGLKAPNRFGLYDMLGNAEEWVLDWYGSLSSDPETEPKGVTIATPGEYDNRILRGGGITSSSRNVRLAMINMNQPTAQSDAYGFRLWAPARIPH